MPQTSQHHVAIDDLRTSQAIDAAYACDETAHNELLLGYLDQARPDWSAIQARAIELVERVRERSRDAGAMEAFMRQYDLSSEEGVILMCLAEALLRIPDAATAERLIADKLADAHWETHLGQSESVFVNASTWSLMLTGKVVRLGQAKQSSLSHTLGRLVARSGEPVIRTAIRQAMKIMGHQYVMGETIEQALNRSRKKANRAYRYSFDMLGEAALTQADADRYARSYADAIITLGRARAAERAENSNVIEAPSISIKLSALHPRYHPDQTPRVLAELTPKVLELAKLARSHDVALTLDAEEAERLTLSLAVFKALLSDDAMAGWNGLGLALQAYQKRAIFVIDHLKALAEQTGHCIPIRLVKGAYWDTEVKLAQVEGLDGYPVFTRKAATDVSYLACAHKLLQSPEEFYPQFATHNAHTIAAIQAFAPRLEGHEYQRLHGMGVELYDEVLDNADYVNATRVYAPVGAHKDLLPYLVRRLLENGANTSFVNQVVDAKISVQDVVGDPVAELKATGATPHPKIPLPIDLYGAHRKNSQGINFAQLSEREALAKAWAEWAQNHWSGGYRGSVELPQAPSRVLLRAPGDTDRVVGEVDAVDPAQAGRIIEAALNAQVAWDEAGVEHRAQCLDRLADALEDHRNEFIVLCAQEAGKTLRDGIAEVREAADFCRYYAAEARSGMATPIELPGPTGEHNALEYRGRGLFVCISPWNFPLAIFVGQVAAALVTGNAVVAKPAEQTTLTATRAVELFHAAGVPQGVLHGVPGDGAMGQALTEHDAVSGVAFTGSTATARSIARSLLDRPSAPLATLIAETGGQNAMIVDSSALPEQVIDDVIASAFLSAGQRCSALRVLCLQEDIAEGMIEMLQGAMAELQIGPPHELTSDLGPIIDADQLSMLQAHATRLDSSGQCVAQAPMPDDLPPGHWFAPRAFLIDSVAELGEEIFGPVLHIVKYCAKDLDELIDQINATGYGLTLGIHSRIDLTQDHIARRACVGNCYVNRNMTGAVVGVQPFGGEGLSGTGPKAGGPNYLYRFAAERVRTTNTAAVGGNASLLALSDE